MEPIEKEEYRGCTIRIFQDDDCENPIKDWNGLSTFVCFHRRYDLSSVNIFANSGELLEYIEKTKPLWLPLFLFDHSGISISTSNKQYPFNCPWDSGQVGIVFVRRGDALKEFNQKRFSKKLEEKIYERMRAEVETFNQYLTGDVYGFTITGKNGEDIDSCWGFYGYEHVIEQAKESIDYYIESKRQEHFEFLKGLIKSKVPIIHRQSCPI